MSPVNSRLLSRRCDGAVLTEAAAAIQAWEIRRHGRGPGVATDFDNFYLLGELSSVVSLKLLRRRFAAIVASDDPRDFADLDSVTPEIRSHINRLNELAGYPMLDEDFG